MKNLAPSDAAALEAVETREWLESLDYVLAQGDKTRVVRLLDALRVRARLAGVRPASTVTTPYVNTIAPHEQVPMPGDRAIERRIKSLVRWNALPWWSAPTGSRTASVATSRRMHLLLLYLRLASTTFSAARNTPKART